MGLLDALRGRSAPVDEWTWDGPMAYDDPGENEDGDLFGPSNKVHFRNPALPGCLITVTYYAVQYASWESDEWGVERCVEYLIGEDGDDFEASSAGLVNATAIYDRAEAEAMAADFAAEDAGDDGVEMYGDWDGEPFETED